MLCFGATTPSSHGKGQRILGGVPTFPLLFSFVFFFGGGLFSFGLFLCSPASVLGEGDNSADLVPARYYRFSFFPFSLGQLYAAGWEF